jgi:hypothetical protein
MYLCMYVYERMNVFMHVCIRVYILKYADMKCLEQTYIYTYIYIHTYAYVHAYMHIDTGMHKLRSCSGLPYVRT